MDVSFVIPTLNEEANIELLLESIERHAPPGLSYETLVIDHGSTDQTVPLASKQATVHVHPTGTIGGLRNLGGSKARGDVLIFLDADVRLTDVWSRNLPQALESLRREQRRITGSWYGVPEGNSWLLRHWFAAQTRIENTHINAGHLIVLRSAFAELEGFDEQLETGEDYEFSMRAESLGFEVLLDDDLPVVHEGYPRSLTEFFRRELWHGKGDMSSPARFLSSQVSIVGTAVVALGMAFLASSFLGEPAAAGGSFALTLAICAAASFRKYGQESLATRLVNAGIYWVYFMARGLSWLPVLFPRLVSRREA